MGRLIARDDKPPRRRLIAPLSSGSRRRRSNCSMPFPGRSRDEPLPQRNEASTISIVFRHQTQPSDFSATLVDRVAGPQISQDDGTLLWVDACE
jgi:hypothetical protein